MAIAGARARAGGSVQYGMRCVCAREINLRYSREMKVVVEAEFSGG